MVALWFLKFKWRLELVGPLLFLSILSCFSLLELVSSGVVVYFTSLITVLISRGITELDNIVSEHKFLPSGGLLLHMR